MEKVECLQNYVENWCCAVANLTNLNWFIYSTLIIIFLYIFLIKPARRIVSAYFTACMAYKLRNYVKNNNINEAQKIIENYPNLINVQFKSDGFTPFLEACRRGNTLLVELMLRNGADINLRTNRGQSGFYLACFNLIENPNQLNADCIHALFYAGSDINAVTNYGYTALHLAAVFGHTGLTHWLMQKNANEKLKPEPYILSQQFGHKNTMNVIEYWTKRKSTNSWRERITTK